jgi:citronellol/citronellal dehydrogenase
MDATSMDAAATGTLRNYTVLITGASRGIGRAIALRLAREGANIVVVAKSVSEDPRLGGTIHSVAEEIVRAGGQALPLQCDIRDEARIEAVVAEAVDHFGGLDALINNASAISLTSTEATDAKRFDLMHDINVRGTFLMTKHCVPHLKQSTNPHIITLSPPVNTDPKWLRPHVAYTLSKFNMSLMTLGWAAEFKEDGIAANALWPATTIATAAVQNLLGGEKLIGMSRKPEIVADAAFEILSKPAREFSGQLLLDEDVLRATGYTDFDQYSVTPGGQLYKDLFL